MVKPLKPGAGGGAGNNQGIVRGGREGVRVTKKSATNVQQHEDAPEVDRTHATDYTDRVDPTTLPKSFGGQQSPLHDLIFSGFDRLAKLYGLDGTQGAFQLQLAALGGSEVPEAAFSAESRKAAVRRFMGPPLRINSEDATKLVDLLAFVVAGAHAQTSKKSQREQAIQQEIDSFRRMVGEMKAAPLNERDAMLANIGEQLLGKANQIAGRLKDLAGMKEKPKSLELVENRIRAVFDIVKIVSKNVLAEAGTPSA